VRGSARDGVNIPVANRRKSEMPVTERFVLVLVLEFVGDVESILWTGLKSGFCPEVTE
jgi:hypothetical protein